jgi:hypothetical protein
LVRDGGYIENSGMLTVEELLPELRGAIDEWIGANDREEIDVPIVVVSADDDPVAGGGDPELSLLPRPFGIGARAGPGNLTRGARDRMQDCRRHPNTDYERVSPGSHAGAEAATGWELSRTAREKDLVTSLRAGEPAWEAVDRIREVIAGRKGVRCAAP